LKSFWRRETPISVRGTLASPGAPPPTPTSSNGSGAFLLTIRCSALRRYGWRPQPPGPQQSPLRRPADLLPMYRPLRRHRRRPGPSFRPPAWTSQWSGVATRCGGFRSNPPSSRPTPRPTSRPPSMATGKSGSPGLASTRTSMPMWRAVIRTWACGRAPSVHISSTRSGNSSIRPTPVANMPPGKSAYSSAGPARDAPPSPLRVGPDVVLPCDESYALGGIRGGGNRSGTVFRLMGTSAAAPQLARYVADPPIPPVRQPTTTQIERRKRGRGNVDPP
jgi:hypothetical protein